MYLHIWWICEIRKKEQPLIFKEYSQRLSRLGSDGCCRFFGLFSCVLEVFLPNVSPMSVAGTFRGQELELCLCSGVRCGIVEYL